MSRLTAAKWIDTSADNRFVLGLLLALSVVSSAVAQDRIIGVASVIDGDTIEIHGQQIRLFGIDALESSQLCVLPTGERHCGPRSSRRRETEALSTSSRL